MRQRRWTSSRVGKALLGVAVAATLPTTAALAQAPGLPRDYDVQRIESPNPIANYHFGWGVASADFTGDGDQDLLVAQSDSFTSGEVFLFDGESGGHIDTLAPPERNQNRPNGTPNFEEFAFVYAEKMADIGSCEGGQSKVLCGLPRVGPQDGIPEIIIGSRRLKVATDGTAGSGPVIGRGYVFDGKTRAVLKKIDMPVAERNTDQSGPAFARSMMSPSGLAPCNGSRADANDAGVARCDGLTPADKLGDMDGLANSSNPTVASRARADIIVTARGYRETSADGAPNSAPSTSQCDTSSNKATPPADVPEPSTCNSGRAWMYRGEEISGTSPREILDGTDNGQEPQGSTAIVEGEVVGTTENVRVLRNPFGQRSSQEFGGNVFRIGDVGQCKGGVNEGTISAPPTCKPAPSGTTNYDPDGIPEIAIADRTVDYPLPNPNTRETLDVGATYVYDGKSGALLTTYTHPQPQPDARFSDGFNAGMAVGDLGNSSLPDLLQGAPGQSVFSAGDGRSYVMNGEASSGRGRQFAILDDATPEPGGQFGSAQTGVGDLVGGTNPANEVLVGSFAPFTINTEFTNSQLINDAFIMNPNSERVLQTILDPDRSPGSGFGVGITPMGDLNEDGFLDFSISSYLSDAPPNGAPSQGRAFIFRSNNRSAAAPRPGQSPTLPRSLRPGTCANDTLGTNRSDRLRGTRMGDRIFGFRGNDAVESFAGGDCLSGGRGRDRLDGDTGNDRLLGGAASDRLSGSRGNDRLFGGAGKDRLSGGRGRDLLAGGTGADTLRGGRGDRLFGEQGKDRLFAGRRARRIDAGAGNDYVSVANGRRDTVNCGAGRDRVRADRSDRLQGCERVKRVRRRGSRG